MHMKLATEHRVQVEMYKEAFQKEAEHNLHQVGGANLLPQSADMQQQIAQQQQQEQLAQQQEQVKNQIQQVKQQQQAEIAQLNQQEKQLAADSAAVDAQAAQQALAQPEMAKVAAYLHGYSPKSAECLSAYLQGYKEATGINYGKHTAVAIPEARPDRLTKDIPLGPKAAQPLASRRNRKGLKKSQRFNPLAKANPQGDTDNAGGYMTKAARWTDEDARWAASPHAAYHNIMTQRDLDPSRLSKDDMAKIYNYQATLTPLALPQQLMKQYESNPMYLNKDERARISAHQAQMQARKKFMADRQAYQAYRSGKSWLGPSRYMGRPGTRTPGQSAVSQAAATAAPVSRLSKGDLSDLYTPKPQQPQSPAMHNLKTFKMQDPTPKPQQPQSPAMHNLKTFKMQDPRFLKARR
jgi:hypothetical protein